MKITKKNILGITILSIFIVSFLLFIIYGRGVKNERDNISSYILECYSNASEIDISKINNNGQSNINTAEEYYANAYNNLLNKKEETGIQQLMKAIEVSNSKTEFMIKYLSMQNLFEILIEQKQYIKCSEYLEIGFNNITINEYNENCGYIVNLLLETSEFTAGRSKIIEIVEDILADKKNNQLSTSSKNAYKDLLATFYVMNGQYADGIELYLDIITNCNDLDNNFDGLRALVELGNTFAILNNEKIALQTYGYVLEQELEDKMNNANIKIYAYVNLLEVLLMQENMDDFFAIVEEMESYYDEGTEYVVNSTKEITNALLLEAYLSIGDIDKASELAKDVKNSIDNGIENEYINNEIVLNIFYSDYLFVIEEYEAACEGYEYAYKANSEKTNKYHDKAILERLINIYDILGDEEKKYKYDLKLTEIVETDYEGISESYLYYIIDRFKYENEINFFQKAKAILIVGFSIIILIFIYILMQLKKQNAQNKIDGLTGIYNRKYFDERYSKRFKTCNDSFIILYDIDDFKMVNDTYGHAFGDEVIKEIAKTSERIVGNRGEVFRYGGEEFTILLKGIDNATAISIAEEIRSAVEKINWYNAACVTISMGLTAFGEISFSTFEKVDNNLYVSKRTGKNKITYY